MISARTRASLSARSTINSQAGPTDVCTLFRKVLPDGEPRLRMFTRASHEWRGHAIELAGHNAIAIYPVSGWWKSHAGQRRALDTARYSLVISISAAGQAVDLYSEIANLVELKQIEVLSS